MLERRDCIIIEFINNRDFQLNSFLDYEPEY